MDVLFRRSRGLVGLDIGSSAVKALELKPAGKGYKVGAIGVEPIPPDSIVDGAIIDSVAVADAIRRLFTNKQFKARDVAASLSGNSVIVKKITLPVMSDQELAESIYWEAEQYIPFDIQDVNLDYEVIDPGTGPESQGAMEVLLVAAKKDKIADYTGVIARPGGHRSSSTWTRSRSRTPTRRTTASSRRASSCCSTPAPARSTSTF
jgi:type IV pilus assembly protein PilM